MGVLGWPPGDFWLSTLYDIERALDGWKRSNGVEDENSVTFEDKVRLQRLFEQHSG